MANSLLCFIPKVWYHWILVPKIQILTYLSLIWTENGVLELRKVTQISNIYIYQNFSRQILGLLKSLFIQSLFKMKGFVTFHGSCLSVHTQKCSKALKKQIREIAVFFQSFCTVVEEFNLFCFNNSPEQKAKLLILYHWNQSNQMLFSPNC